MRTHYFAVERAQLFHGRPRCPIRVRHRTTPCYRHWHICPKDGAILTHQFGDPNFDWPRADEIEWRIHLPRLQPQHARFWSDMMLLLEGTRQPFDSWVLEKLRNVHIHVERLIEFGNDANCEQRVAAQLEEVVVQPHTLHSKSLAPDARHSLLRLCDGRREFSRIR